jgi:CRISPR system Cascade subunit CasE
VYISKLELNERDRSVRHDLSNIHHLHQRIMQAFPDVEQNKVRADWDILFRLEPDSNIVLVQSGDEVLPDWNRLPNGYLLDRKIVPFVIHSDNLQSGKLFHFRLKANPSKRLKETRKTVGLYSQSDQIAWLERQAAARGFQIQMVDVVPTANVFGKKKGNNSPIKIHTAIFQGILEVRDADLLLTAVREGIGRAKAYGCGLLSIKKIDRS